MSDFSIVKKGYDIKQVDGHIKKLIGFTEEKMQEQRKRIDELKEENRILFDRIEEYKKAEKTVSEAIISATKKAGDILTAAKMRYALECERIKLMRLKWTQYVESASEKVRAIDESVNMQAYLIKMEDELKEALNSDLNIKKTRTLNEAEEQFISENERLTGESCINVMRKALKEETKADKSKDYTEKVRKSIQSNIKKEIELQEESDEEDLIDDEELIDDSGMPDELPDELPDDLPDNPLPELFKEMGLIPD
ncbi:MAG: DivIVA domain-containing protein [Christensenellales bacterium]|jgi:hypothetical protein